MNRLDKERSPYLRHAAHQKIDWYPWSEEAFRLAREQDKPVFLSSGAIWCHWCHVMAKECFEDAEIADLLNEHFVCIKIDRDERPEIDRRYQNAVSAMGFGGGWPLSVFLDVDKRPFFGGTYFPPEDTPDRPGFKKILKTMADFYKSRRGDLLEVSEKLMTSLKPQGLEEGDLSEAAVEAALWSILTRVDTRNGGFGSSPKFPAPGAMGLLIHKYYFIRMESIGFAVRKTLEAMAKGGFYDHLGGGFHRYSVDESWIIPHFEKMTDDNAWHIRNYIDAYSVFGDPLFKEVAEGIIRFVGSTLSDPEGGFYSSQDADVTPDDEGGYFTWTDDEFGEVLNNEEYRVLNMHFGRRSMHHNPEKQVLYVSQDAAAIAEKEGLDLKKVSGILDAGKEKLLRYRNQRETPFIDKTFYTSLNGMMISSYLKAGRVLRDGRVKEFALKSLERIRDLRLTDGQLFHVEGVKALLDDYIYLAEAFLEAYETTGEARFLDEAEKLVKTCLASLWDSDEGGFFDTESEVLGLRLKNIEDVPHPSANSISIMLLLKLYFATGKSEYHQYAETALKRFANQAKKTGLHAGSYYCALDAFYNMLKLSVEAAPGGELAEAVHSSYYPYKSIVYGHEDRGFIVPCLGLKCYEPILNASGLRDFLNSL
ncbi:MAG TPA: thioredoxin domain-containing protein [Thermodesulfovibrionales bacterium]|nr:thioredoxin domain-containing protein [Thermodesulfovibrionales bacterium]